MAKLSKSSINSFCGDVLPLQLLAEEDLSNAPITWSVEGDAAIIRGFADGYGDGFTNGVLVTLVQEGDAVICAEHEDTTYYCPVAVRPARKADPNEEMNYYIADLHIHTSHIHRHDPFVERDSEFPEDLVAELNEKKVLDCAVITDHAGVMKDRDFFRGFLAEEKIPHPNVVIFPGAEGSLTPVAPDRLGQNRKQFGEMLTLNLDNYIYGSEIDVLYRAISQNFMGFGAFVHPQVIGWDQCGVWNCAARENATKELKNLIRLVEMGTGEVRESNISYEFVYSEVLDCGYKVAPECASDSHAQYKPVPGKAIIMAPGKSKELFMDAIRNCRVYATSSGLVKLKFLINGYPMAQTLPLTDTYQFHVELGLLQEEESAWPVTCQVISDYGMPVKTLDCKGLRTLDFELKSDNARYFYLRLIDSEGRKTWSAPIWTGRAFDEIEENDLIALDKAEFTAMDETTGQNAEALLDNDSTTAYTSESSAPAIVIDMKKLQKVCAVGHVAPVMIRRPLMDAGVDLAEKTAEFVSRFCISTSCDGKTWTPGTERIARMFGREEIFEFPEREARYVKFQVLSSVGLESAWPRFAQSKVSIAELTVFSKEK